MSSEEVKAIGFDAGRRWSGSRRFPGSTFKEVPHFLKICLLSSPRAYWALRACSQFSHQQPSALRDSVTTLESDKCHFPDLSKRKGDYEERSVKSTSSRRWPSGTVGVERGGQCCNFWSGFGSG